MPPRAPDQIELALALRDFFYAQDEASRLAALAALHGGAAPAEGLEFEFNRLFVGPAAPQAPPYASVYLEKESRLMGASTLQMRSLLTTLGVAAPSGMPDDFIAFELEAWLLLAGEMDADARRARAWLEEHLRAWLPLFLARLRAAALSAPMLHVAAQLERWLAALADCQISTRANNIQED